MKAQRAAEAEAQRWIALAAQHRAERERLVPVAPGVWARVGSPAPPPVTPGTEPQRPVSVSPALWEHLLPEDKQAIAQGNASTPPVAQAASPQQTADAWTQAELQRARNWLWSHPEALAAALTDNPAGRDYLTTILPELIKSPTARAVIEALLARSPVDVSFFPEWEWLHNPPPWMRSMGFRGVPNVQPWGNDIYMANANQPAHIFAHEAAHLLARAAGVDPNTFLGESGGSGRPGKSLQMEREAYIIETLIRFELESDKKEKTKRAKELRSLIMGGDDAAFAQVKEFGKGAYDGYDSGNEPRRDWRVDLLAMGFSLEVIQAIWEAAMYGLEPVKE